MKSLYLKKGEDRRILAGHLWIFSNEVDAKRSSLKQFEPGEGARVYSASGRPLGAATVNPHALICARLHSRDPGQELDANLLRERVSQALDLREHLYGSPYYRLIYSEGDSLPGLIVDQYGDVLAVQLLTAAMDRRRDMVLEVLNELCDVESIVLKNDAPVRELEGLDRVVEAGIGEIPETVDAFEGPNRFIVPLARGQKTGWFYDQRPARETFCQVCARLGCTLSQSVSALDVYSYAGGFALAAARAGLAATAVDSSQRALEAALESAHANDLELEALKGDAAEVMQALQQEGRMFAAVSLDPPAFVKRSKDLKKGLAGYAKINRLGLALVESGGVLLSSSCSQHVSYHDLRSTVAAAAAKMGRRVQLLASTSQGPDHPAHPSMPETSYLKGLLVRVLD